MYNYTHYIATPFKFWKIYWPVLKHGEKGDTKPSQNLSYSHHTIITSGLSDSTAPCSDDMPILEEGHDVGPGHT